MTTRVQSLTVITLAGTILASQAQTTSTAATNAPTLGPTEQMLQDIKHPVSWLTWGGDLRVRNEYFNNALSLTSDPAKSPFAGVHAQDYFRFRGRVWTSIVPTDGLSLNARLAAEPRDFMEPGFSDTYFEQSGMQWRYGILDNLNVQWRKPMDLPLSLTVGRQDIFLGDGWLVGDGTPEDGSFTYFLDAARLTYDLKEAKTTIDAIGIVQYGRPDAWLPTLGPSTSVPQTPVPQGGHVEPFLLTDQDEKGAILWIANKSLPAMNLDGYFIYKHDTALNDYPTSLFTDNADIYTFGGRVSGLVQEHWKYSAEGAYQFGRKQYPLEAPASANEGAHLPTPNLPDSGDHNLSAYGVNSKVGYAFNDTWNDQVFLNFEWLSGDNPGSATDEGFDVLWGRWPRWSEMYNIYSYVSETRVGQMNNIWRIGPSWTISPIKKMDFSLSYDALFAEQEVPTRAVVPTVYSNNGLFRGHYLQAVLKYKFSEHVSGHLWSEFMFPGDYYVDKGMISFLRAELLFTF